MTKEQEEAIKYLEESILIYKNAIPKMSKAIETVLNILKQNSAEIEQKNTELAEKSAEIEKKDKIIDLMTEIFYKRFKAELLLEYGFESKEEIKQYFERKSEE